MTTTRRDFAGKLLPFCVALLIALAATPSSAHPFDTWGFTSRDIAMGGAATASATDVDAAYYNPAAAVRTPGLVTSLGVLVADDFLQTDGADADIPTHLLFQAGLAAPLPLGELLRDRLFLTFALSLPYDGLYDIKQPDDEQPTVSFWDARNRRVVLTGSLAGRITDWLSVGVGVTLLPDVFGKVSVDLTGTTGDNTSHVEVNYDFAATAGLLVTPVPWLSVGVAYRQAQTTRIDLPVSVDVLSDVEPVRARVVSPAYALPHEVALGVEIRPLPTLTVVADVTWYDYSAFRYSSPDVTVFDTQGEVIQKSRAATVQMSDVFAPRLGVEWQALPWLAVRGGYAWAASPIPKQTGVTNLLDADRHVLSLGGGFDIPGAWLGDAVRRISVDVHAQLTLLRRRAFEKSEFLPDNPGWPTVSLSGGTFSAGASLRVWF